MERALSHFSLTELNTRAFRRKIYNTCIYLKCVKKATKTSLYRFDIFLKSKRGMVHLYDAPKDKIESKEKIGDISPWRVHTE